MYCRKCGTLISEGEQYCSVCGTGLPETQYIEQKIEETHNSSEEIEKEIPNSIQENKEVNSSIPLELPLYGYEPYNPEKYAAMKEQEAQIVPPAETVPQQIPHSESPYISQQVEPLPVASANPTVNYIPGPVPNPYVNRNAIPNVYSNYEVPAKKPKGNRVGLLIVILSIMFIIVFICLTVISSTLSDIRNILYDYTYYYDDYSDENNTYSSGEENEYYAENSKDKGDEAAYEWLIKDYFELARKSDSDAIAKLLHPAVVEALEENGYRKNEYAKAIDAFVDYYGKHVENYNIVDIYPYSTSDYAALVEKIGFDQASLEAYVDVFVSVSVRTEETTEDLWYDFDLVKIDSQWYLVSIW